MTVNGQFAPNNIKSAKLTWTDVRRIRELYAEGWSQGDLSREFDVGVAQIGKIVRNECWKERGLKTAPRHIPEERLHQIAQLSTDIKEGRVQPLAPIVPVREGVSGEDLAMKALTERAQEVRGQFGKVDDVPEPGRELAPGDYSDPTGRRG